MALFVPVLLLLAGCKSASENPLSQVSQDVWVHRMELAKVTHVEQVEKDYVTEIEKYPCKMGGVMSTCSKKRQIHRPAGVETKILRDNGTTVSFFAQDTSSFLTQATGKTVCVEAQEHTGKRLWVIVAVTPNTDDSLCATLPEADLVEG